MLWILFTLSLTGMLFDVSIRSLHDSIQVELPGRGSEEHGVPSIFTPR